MMLGQALVPVAIGLAIAVPLAVATGSWLRSLLFDLTPTDPAAIVPSCIVLATTALIAAYVPARRAAGVDPLTALRYE